MKKILLSLVALLCATVSFAQSQIATITHGDEIKTFYGPESFKEAMVSANHGDIITLSSGQFNGTTINKAITLRGAGMVEVNGESGYQAPTVIQGNISVSIADDVTQKVNVEGVKFAGIMYYHNTLNNPTFRNCYFGSISSYSSIQPHYIKNAVLINCRVRNSFYLSQTSSATCINSIIQTPYYTCTEYSGSDSKLSTKFDFVNCVLIQLYCTGHSLQGSTKYCLENSTFRNCYIDINGSLRATNIVENCCSNNSNAFLNSINPFNKIVAETEMFATYIGEDWDDNEKFVLKEEAASTYLGDDGTQIGIYGGSMPYNERISMPRITKCNVAGKSTADGKLSVDIQVEAAQ